jgi:hypothetical protein
MIETMCNKILGNYTKKEDQLMTAAFGTRLKRRLNRVMDALNFEYPDYERLNKGAEGQKRKRIVSVMSRQAARMVKEDEEILKRKKSSPEPKAAAPKKRKVVAPKTKTTKIEEETPSTPSATDVEEILKVMTESLPITLSPLGPHLTKLLQKNGNLSAAKKSDGPKRQRIITMIEAIEETPPLASASKTPAVEDATVTEAALAEAATAEDTNLEDTFSDIDKMLLNMVVEEAATAAEETLATVPGKEKKITEDTSEEKDFNFQNIIGQKLSKAEKKELRDYAISCGYQPGALLFGGIDDESLGCLRDRTGAKVISTLSKSIGFPKLEADISRYRCVQRLKQVFNSVGASSEKFEPSVEDLPGTFEHIKGEVDALDEVIAGHGDFCALLASRGTAIAFMKTGCTHGKFVNIPNFSLPPVDLTDIPSLARSIGNRFITQI